MKGKNLTLIIVIVFAIGAILFTLNPFTSGNKYNIDRYIDKNLQDTLLTNVVTYMGVKPKYADFESRHEEQYRKFYVEQSKDYSFNKYFVDRNNRHYFYVIRPARHAVGNRRAIGGWMMIDERMNIVDYYEVFVTHVMEEDTLEKIAPELFGMLINNNIQDLNHKHKRIEWPDDRLKYHPVKKEWRYDVPEN
jgi:hypothetical protein